MFMDAKIKKIFQNYKGRKGKVLILKEKYSSKGIKKTLLPIFFYHMIIWGCYIIYNFALENYTI